LIELFDTTPDLAGNDIDVDLFIRAADGSDARVFWRNWDGVAPPEDEPGPSRDELCPVPISELREFAKSARSRNKIFRRDFLERRWMRADSAAIYPGQTFMIHTDAGGYTGERGWNLKSEIGVRPPIGTLTSDGDWVQYERELRRRLLDLDDYDDDGLSRTDRWQTIAEHTEAVCNELERFVEALTPNKCLADCLRQAARWHDWGKAHGVFQNAIADGRPGNPRPSEWTGYRNVAKAPGLRRDRDGSIVEKGFWKRYDRRHFRHELASALGVLQVLQTGDLDRALLDRLGHLSGGSTWQPARDLIAYAIAAHHGKVRLSIRSLPNETKPTGGDHEPAIRRRFARGVWDGDVLPPMDLGGRVIAPEVTLSVEPMELGLCELPPFQGQPSWVERVLRLRDAFGPFQLAFMETLLRAADCRASVAADAGAVVSRMEPV
jgi:CRISPR-associated endonuclease/helicase Cas3